MIRARVTDAAAFTARTPAELSAYLRTRGWELQERTESVAIWSIDTPSGVVELMQPLDQNLRDYASRMADAVEILAALDNASELDVLRQISETVWDVHTVRIFPADKAPGRISVEDGVTAMESLRTLISAAAYPVFSRQHRAVQPSRKPQGMIDYLRSVRIGPASEGSFVLSLHTPVPPRLTDQPALFDDTEPDEPPERQVSLGLYRAVRAAHDASDAALISPDGLEPFTTAVPSGLSANLCEALAGFGGAEGNPFELSLALASTRSGVATLHPIRFRRHHVPVLREAAVELRARTPEEDVTVVGEVVRLHRESAERGEITLVGRVEDSEALRRIWADLPAEDYDAAMRAHQQMRQVSVRGNLIRRGTRSHLARPSGFHILDEYAAD